MLYGQGLHVMLVSNATDMMQHGGNVNQAASGCHAGCNCGDPNLFLNPEARTSSCSCHHIMSPRNAMRFCTTLCLIAVPQHLLQAMAGQVSVLHSPVPVTAILCTYWPYMQRVCQCYSSDNLQDPC